MNKTELTIVVLLFALLISWGYIQRSKPVPEQVAPPAPEAVSPDTLLSTQAVDTATVPEVAEAAVKETAADIPAADLAAARPEPLAPLPPEETVLLTNDVVRMTLSSRGGAITSVELMEYRETVEKDSGPVRLDFSARPTLTVDGLPGLGSHSHYALALRPDTRTATAEAASAAGIRLTRQVTLGDDYEIQVVETFENEGDAAATLPVHSLAVGPMEMIRSKAQTRGISYLGMDTLADAGGEKVQYWGKGLSGLFGARSTPFSCARPNVAVLPVTVTNRLDTPLAWVAVKNKFFVELLAPEGGSAGGVLHATRDPEEERGLVISTVSADMSFLPVVLQPGEPFKRELVYYVGPKSYSRLRQMGKHQDEVMQFGFFKPICKILLPTLKALYRVIPNYGVAIILLTLIVRIIFWPITHKSTESMKKMQQIQPLVAKIREKHKDKPQKMNQEIMALYKEHKVNPMAGCLPMVVQIPVFIGLFTVLRSAVELRFAPFLWVQDLSEPERLIEFGFALPVIGWDALNLLPLVMAGTMVWQQRLTPASGDAQQQRMMFIFMPIMMLFFLYNMASALMLYWSVSQLLAIVQLLLQRRKVAAKT